MRARRKYSADFHRMMGNNSFNRFDFKAAASEYTSGLKSLYDIGNELEDEDYRDIIEISINLSDAFMHLSNLESANQAFDNAIAAFKRIIKKTPDEQRFANANDGYVSLRAYYEKKLSTENYLNSQEFKNNDRMLIEKQEEHQVEDMLDDLTVSPEAADEKSLFASMEKFSFTPQLPFTQIASFATIPDDQYRSTANQLVSYAKQQYANQQLSDAVKTLVQARETLEKVRVKTTPDQDLLKELQDNVQQLRDQISARELSQRALFSPAPVRHSIQPEQDGPADTMDCGI